LSFQIHQPQRGIRNGCELVFPALKDCGESLVLYLC
jgi:hypothetical protein